MALSTEKKLHSQDEWLNHWNHRWSTQDIKFHKLNPNEGLVECVDKFTLGREHLTILVPLCGKSVDLLWLHQLGHMVIGIELSTLAIESFFNEQNLKFTKEEIFDGKIVYENADKRIRIFQGDLFEFNVDIIGQVDAIWDRGCLVALPEERLVDYVTLIKPFLKKDFRYLLETFEYEDDEEEDPFFTPHSVSREKVQELFGSFCNLEHLRSEDKSQFHSIHIGAQLIMLYHILLTDKF